MKKRTNNKMITLTKKESKRAFRTMEKEIKHILKTFDYTNYEMSIYYDEDTNTMIIPKPVFAQTFVNEQLLNTVIGQINIHPNCMVMFE